MPLSQLIRLAALAAILGFAAHAQAAAPSAMGSSSLSKGDQRIVVDMAQANMAELALAKIAQSKSQDSQVKQFAQQMIDDHGKALADVQQLAQAKGVTLPAAPTRKQQAEADKLSALSGAAFDSAYLKQAGVSDHHKVHAALQKMAGKAKDADVKALADKMLPTVDQHLNTAEQMAAAMRNGSKAGATGTSGTAGTSGTSGTAGTSGTSSTPATPAAGAKPAASATPASSVPK